MSLALLKNGILRLRCFRFPCFLRKEDLCSFLVILFQREGLSFSNWDKWVVQGAQDFKLKNFLKYFKVSAVVFIGVQRSKITRDLGIILVINLLTKCCNFLLFRISMDLMCPL